MARILKLTTATTSKGFAPREETFDGRPHLVVPVVALVEGVLHAMNSATPEMVLAEEFTRPAVVGGFNGRPLYHGHPLVNGEPVSGNDPTILEDLCIGRVFHAAAKNNKLTMEAWIDIERCEKIAPDLLARVKDAKDIEISVGVFCESDEDETGEHEGRKYAGAWRDIVPDHLALLLEGDHGACSREMGCGVRAAVGIGNNQYKHDESSTGSKDKVADTFSGQGGTFSVSNPDGEAYHVTDKKGNTVHLSSTKSGAVSKAREYAKKGFKGKPIIKANKEEAVSEEKKSKAATALTKFLSLFRSTQAPEEMSDNDVRRNLLEALRDDDKTVNYVEAFYPNASPATVVYSCYFPSTACGPEMGMGYQSCMYQRSYTVGENGVVTLDADIVEVEPVLTYQPVPAEGEEAPTAALGAPCKCHDHKDTRSAIDMTKEQIAKFLETATDEQVKALSAVAEPPTPAATEPKVEAPAAAVVETPKVETPAPVASAAKTPTFEEMLAAAEPSVRDAINAGKSVGDEKRAATVKALKDTGRCDLSDQELGAMTQAQLDGLVKLAGSAKTDFSAAGSSRPQGSAEAIPPAPDMSDAIRTARGTK